MSISISEVETLVRYLLGETSKTQNPGDIFTYTSSSVFTLTEVNVINVTTVLVNDIELGSGEWSYDSDTNKVTVTHSLTANDTVEIRYTYYPNYSSSEIQDYIRAAVVHLSTNNYYTFSFEGDDFYPEPTEQEKNTIALVTSLLIEPDNKSYSLPDLRINVPKDLPMHQKIARCVAIAKHNTHGSFDIL